MSNFREIELAYPSLIHHPDGTSTSVLGMTKLEVVTTQLLAAILTRAGGERAVTNDVKWAVTYAKALLAELDALDVVRRANMKKGE